MKLIYLDIMVRGMFVAQLPYRYNPIFALEADELRDYVISKRPTLKNKKFTIEFSTNRV